MFIHYVKLSPIDAGGYNCGMSAEEKLCRLVSEFVRVCQNKFRVNEGKSKVEVLQVYEWGSNGCPSGTTCEL